MSVQFTTETAALPGKFRELFAVISAYGEAGLPRTFDEMLGIFLWVVPHPHLVHHKEVRLQPKDFRSLCSTFLDVSQLGITYRA